MNHKKRVELRRERLGELQGDRSRRIKLLLERGWIRSATDVPDECIPIDINTSTKATLFWPELWYADIEFKCGACGKIDNWWADQQQVYFEVLKSSPYKVPRLCYDCRIGDVQRKEKARKAAGPQPKAEQGADLNS